MVTEHAVLSVIPGKEDEFEAAFGEARGIIAAADGCLSVSLSRSIESPSSYLFLVDWETVEHHVEGFRQSEAFAEWRALLHHFYDPFPVVEHFEAVASASS